MSAHIVQAFKAHCGVELFERFVEELKSHTQTCGCMRYWQEKCWSSFVESYDSQLSKSPTDIGLLFGIPVSEHIIPWSEIKNEVYYILDLVQYPTGRRLMQARLPDSPVMLYTIFSTVPATGYQLLHSPEDIFLENGDRFTRDEEYGTWMTIPEANLLFRDKYPSDGQEPWINGIPPLPPRVEL